MNCPLCGAYSVGQIGRKSYYCGECYHQWVESDGYLKVFKISVDGTLVREKSAQNKRHLEIYFETQGTGKGQHTA